MMCWMIPLIVGILSALLGYWLGKSGKSVDGNELQRLREENTELHKTISVLREKQTFDFNDKSRFLSESQQLIDKYKDGTQKDSGKAVDDTVGKPSDISLSEADVTSHSLYQALLSQHADTKAALAQLQSGDNDLVISDDAVTSHALYQGLLSERDAIQKELAQKNSLAQSAVTDKAVESHELYQGLLTKYNRLNTDLATAQDEYHSVSEDDVKSHSLYQGLLSERDTMKTELMQLKADDHHVAPSDADVEAHATYKDLLTRFNATKVTLNENQRHIEQLIAENQTLQDKSNKLDEDAVKNHPLYGELLTQYEQAKSQSLSDDAVKSHTVYQLLEKQKHALDTQYQQESETLKQLRDENEQLSQSANSKIKDYHELEQKLTSEGLRINELLQTVKTLEQDKQELQVSLSACEANLDAQQADSNHANTTSIASAATATNVVTTFDASAAKQVFGKRIKQDDLTIVLGIGPKIEELFRRAGIDTWYQLSQASVDDCQKILADAGERFQMHDPGTWPRQAKYASDGDWQGLFDWQKRLDGGREV